MSGLVSTALSPIRALIRPLVKSPQQLAAPPRATINDARLRADEADRLAGRRGTNANNHVGFGAGEAFTGPKKSLLGRS